MMMGGMYDEQPLSIEFKWFACNYTDK